MPVPTRLANDGWWLCSLPTTPSIDAASSPAKASQNLMTNMSFAGFRTPMTLLPCPHKLAVAAGATALADWLFYGHTAGLSLALFLVVLAALSLLTSRVRPRGRDMLIAAAILIAGLVPIVEDPDALSAPFGILGLAVAVAFLTNPFLTDLHDYLRAVVTLLLTGPFRLLSDATRSRIWSLPVDQLTSWIVPLVLGGIFLGLFVSANPLIENLFTFDVRKWSSPVSLSRLLFWGAMVSVTWPFLALRWKRSDTTRTAVGGAQPGDVPAAPAEIDPFTAEVFGTAAILRSLVQFNLMFAVQTVLDLVYLWGGVALPDGMTYASYAHRGAYPLMLTALLAAGFVLAAVVPGGPAERRPAIRILVFAWIAQNVMLVISSILRLDLYVETYSLTYWRLAAIIWMLLVAMGLVLIVARIALDRSNSWLVMANLATLALVLYACALINFPWVISTYNVAHSREVSGKGALVDFNYLAGLGPQALPAIDRYLRHPLRTHSTIQDTSGSQVATMDQQRDWLVQRHRCELDSWRAWNFRGWRLSRYLDQATQVSAAPGETVDPSHSRR
jgi:hypothetical protein